ncbi:MAG TPA: TonB-dependent receptor, partial [Planctomycetota bacterium]|nr:TonB-dependent receptor [Planctomycetota bacterium]
TEDSDEHVYVNANSSGVVRVTGLELEGTEWLPQSFARELVGERALSCYGNATWIAGRDSGNDEPLDRGFPANVLVGLRVDETRDPALSSYWMGVDTWLVRSFDRIPGDRYASDPAFFDDPQDPSSGPLRDDGSVPGFTIFNLRGGWELDERKTMTVAVENLFNKRYRVKDSRIDEPGINLVLGLDIRF